MMTGSTFRASAGAMLIRATLGVVVLLTALIVASPSRAEFMGAGYISQPHNCTWPTQTEMTRARYRAVEHDGGNQSEIVLTYAVGGVSAYQIRGNLEPRRWFLRARSQVLWGGFYNNNRRSRVRIVSREGAVYRDSPFEGSDAIRLRFQVANFNGEIGCTVTVQLMMRRWN